MASSAFRNLAPVITSISAILAVSDPLQAIADETGISKTDLQGIVEGYRRNEALRRIAWDFLGFRGAISRGKRSDTGKYNSNDQRCAQSGSCCAPHRTSTLCKTRRKPAIIGFHKECWPSSPT